MLGAFATGLSNHFHDIIFHRPLEMDMMIEYRRQKLKDHQFKLQHGIKVHRACRIMLVG